MPDERRHMLERELGRMLLDYAADLRWEGAVEKIEGEAANTLRKIQDLLNDEGLSDFDCIDAIGQLLENIGLDTSRHDFG